MELREKILADIKSATVLTEMRGRMDAWMKRTNDPLLRGPVAAPRGSKINAVDGVSPRETPQLVP